MKDITAIKKRFRNSIKKGTGETYLIMKKYPKIDFSSDIIKASLTNFAHDRESEGSRAYYIYELIKLSKQKQKIRKAILNQLAIEEKDTSNLVQLFDLAANFAEHGDKEAREAIYKRFFKKINNVADWCGYDAIIKLDGFEGLKFIASTIGEFLEKNPDDWQDSSIISHFQEENPKIDTWKELEKVAQENRFIKIYLENVKRTEDGKESSSHATLKANYEKITNRINDEKRIVPLFPIEAKLLKKSDIKKLADDFLKETDRKKLEKYMKVFDRVKYPYEYAPILKIVKGRNSKKDRLVEFAAGALKYFPGDDIREFAIKKLSITKTPDDYLDLLVSNYKKGDYKLLTRIAKRCKNENKIHSIVYSYIRIYKANTTKECKQPLEAIYEKLTCGLHREDIIKILIKNKVLFKKIRNEIRYDSYEEIRKLSAKL